MPKVRQVSGSGAAQVLRTVAPSGPVTNAFGGTMPQVVFNRALVQSSQITPTTKQIQTHYNTPGAQALTQQAPAYYDFGSIAGPSPGMTPGGGGDDMMGASAPPPGASAPPPGAMPGEPAGMHLTKLQVRAAYVAHYLGL